MDPSPAEYLSPAIVSTSLGAPDMYSIREKLEQAAENYFAGVEISFDEVDYPSEKDLFAAAERIASLCRSLGLEIVAFGPFQRYEGLRDRVRHNAMIDILQTQFSIAMALGARMIIITANHLPQHELSEEFILEDLKLISQWGVDMGISIAYSFTCYSTIINRWWKAWEVVKLIDSPNFGLCLDTFQIAGGLGDDTSALSYNGTEESIRRTNSLNRMIEVVPPNRIFHLQVSSAVPFVDASSPSHPWYTPRETPLMSWSRHGKGFLFENPLGGDYSMEDLAKYIVLGSRYKGYISMEASIPAYEKGLDVPNYYASRARAAWARFLGMLELTEKPNT
ncbi:xylose isomerase-like protein [Daldinia vernicosa]|uniref:xylose isomerase-like protein n=1 Tax=Daldinia vernicosa TaxID=114800 RepID=UPI002007A988|nr:xylose isomerase-like protein [Daldinia vernicosa]KAI0845831.1 xylose isomerase-like protein [Daldinia vernicosa]